MKKSIALVALAFGVTNAFAQDLTSKKGEPMLPEAGDWGIAIDATPFLDYAGNFFGKSANNTSPTWNFFTSAQTITGKYFADPAMAYRGSLRIGIQSATTRTMVTDQLKSAALSPTANGYPAADPMVENKWKRSNTVIGLSGGIEKRKGKTRLQGYYGGEVGIYMDMQKDKFEYGNTLAATASASTNVNVTAADDFGTPNNVSATAPISGLIGSARATEIKRGTIFSFGVRGFIGAEYFVLPKMSIGGEFGWGLGISSQGKSETQWESVGDNGNPANTTNSVGQTTIEGSKNGGFWLDTDNRNSMWGPTASLRLNLHF
ncbi:MAG: hypothetical protein K0S32_252 [Bacteroidetes bacterium]|jgi:hypothetical protein|nr:hypothetical protein [Bacteroidota bacterium]